MECKKSHIPLNKQLEAMLRVSGVLLGLPLVEVEGHADQALRCDNNHLTFEDLVKSCIGTDSCGKPALRVKFIDSCNTKTTCKNNGDADPLKQMFCYDASAGTYAIVLNMSE
jgi:hypothetical protein